MPVSKIAKAILFFSRLNYRTLNEVLWSGKKYYASIILSPLRKQGAIIINQLKSRHMPYAVFFRLSWQYLLDMLLIKLNMIYAIRTTSSATRRTLLTTRRLLFSKQVSSLREVRPAKFSIGTLARIYIHR